MRRASRATRDGDLNNLVPIEIVNAARWKEAAGSRVAAQDLKKHGHRGRDPLVTVDGECSTSLESAGSADLHAWKCELLTKAMSSSRLTSAFPAPAVPGTGVETSG